MTNVGRDGSEFSSRNRMRAANSVHLLNNCLETDRFIDGTDTSNHDRAYGLN